MELSIEQREKLNELSSKLFNDFGVFTKIVDRQNHDIYFYNINNLCSEISKNTSLCKYHKANITLDNKNTRQVSIKRCEAGFYTIGIPVIKDKFYEGSIIVGPFKKDDFSLVETAIVTKLDESHILDFDESIMYEEDKVVRLIYLLDYIKYFISELFQNMDLSSQHRQYSMLGKLSKITNSSLDIDSLMRKVVYFIVDGSVVDNCSLLFFDARKRFVASNLPDMYKDIEHDLVEQIKKDKQSRFIDNVENICKMKSESLICHKKISSFPLIFKDALLGVLTLYHEKELNSKLFDIISDQLAIAIANAREFTKVKEESVTDTLTGFYNRRAFVNILERELNIHSTKKQPISVAMVDVDHFGHYNNTNGHPAGDRALIQLSQLFKQHFGPDCVIGRYGGEEFIVIFKNTDYNTAIDKCSGFVALVRNTPFEFQEKQPHNNFTISIGLFSCLDSSCQQRELIKIADDMLYKSKEAGRDRLSVAFKATNNTSVIEMD